ncbi:nucleotidyl transferase AbiEii/AbiGii toxin family protein [Phycicoccus sp. SLBN-51]|uniref:nucleotidyl transferase AbiEii/AbiGii toxin family protein n=1 Tax=Phycicoccus sp. SLBN-51 TaxID=2768447 RepID=UPI00114EE947|nr:nucleotidyl transferase AbiEii/AbiGii toxin family protein [Phycicoccus sp. SLBN-51]TQJ49272.1 nucleotidyltransferase AbiEii toxin of type IV toxin-antitoxin system [Phycicoccus sp. SLBN-51]
MSDKLDLLAWFRDRVDRGKPPNSKAVLDKWLTDAQRETKVANDRLSWLVASTVATAVLQRAVMADGGPRFLLKGGTYINYLLSWEGRTTKDVDGLVRGDLDDFITELDAARTEDWGPFKIDRSEVEEIKVPNKLVNPRRFFLHLQVKGMTWRKIKVEISPDEGAAGRDSTPFMPADLKSLGIPTPAQLLGIALRFQIAQKLHACSDPHEPPEYRNERARDVVDLILLRRLEPAVHSLDGETLKEACMDVFAARATEAAQLGRLVRVWPPVVQAHPGWDVDYRSAAAEGGLDLGMDEAIAEVNAWIDEIDAA